MQQSLASQAVSAQYQSHIQSKLKLLLLRFIAHPTTKYLNVCISVDDLLNLDCSIPHIDRVWREREKHSKLLSNKLPEASHLAQMNVDLLNKIVGKDVLDSA
jgi:hypothetical protein